MNIEKHWNYDIILINKSNKDIHYMNFSIEYIIWCKIIVQTNDFIL